ncbi:MAG: CDP-diacylglycerol--serine O-phosphatidyltransferase [Acidobacteriota bacterium]|jgi:CDP-diacylglycerol--serine O-phosphatidyltransferase|nr:CDP-diacylglycerol--serine O-phosphatidyltransferase [Acidobacteriota bacterium]
MSEMPEENAPPAETDETVAAAAVARSKRLRRSVFVLPSLLTVANLFCGYYAILSTMNGAYRNAAIAIMIAILLDSMDGAVARLTNTASDFGLQLDSLSDIISFGVAPSILALRWGLQLVDTHLAWAAAFTFTICGAMRLARFNIQAGGHKYFVGLPIPAAGGAIAATAYFFGKPVSSPLYANCMVAVTLALAFLMVSTLRYSSLKGVTLGRKSHLAVLVIALLFVLIYSWSQWTLLILAIAYVASGFVLKAFSLLRRKNPDGGATPI